MANLKLKIAVILFTLLYFFSSTAAPVLAAISYLYDQNGNMISDGTKCYEYNEANQQKRVKNCSNNQTIAEYVYDYQGNRLVKKTYSSGVLQKTTFSPNDGYEAAKLASNSAIQNTSYYFVNDQLIAKKTPDGTKNYYHNDHLGSTSVMTNQSGVLVEETKYDPWGEVKTGGTKSKFLFTGQEKDLETNLNYYNARYYDSHIRRFTQPDDIIQNVYDPQSLNRYSYVRNNPLRYTDPTGHYAETALDIAFIGMDLNSIRNDPTNLWNWAALGGDAIGAAVPLGTGFGLGIKTIEHGGDVKKAITSYAKAGNKLGNTGQGGSAGRSGGNSSINAQKAAASQKQMQETGKIIFGSGSQPYKVFNDAGKFASQYGGKASDWVKKASSDFQSIDKGNTGKFQTHWTENIKTGFRTWFKTVFTSKEKK